MPHLVVTCTFNPPKINLMTGGGANLRENTIQRLNQVLPQCTTTSMSPKQVPPQLEYKSNPPHWHVEMGTQNCDHIARSNIYLTIIESLEAEDWVMRAAHAMSHNSHSTKSTDAGMDTTRLFFYRP
jgi:hypothetical protein|eukprot:CAMPEP_0174285244 /NCGR_PEP_ID=MMETSP0809-20121228/8118_1 /TAXON_ID=73025 ORGANISM="Eutreptiella gymnastica-like, Strain CCMP1594" /NCGR_SAMPLE_ID=MMETSP0809 /ASSEMBLY_ACC=CAM_ASM_000658 /LENGTH=125 /DNA_ID=CAMNT_0015380957 /DNA_START=32 /DNA_END=409 /DNA_ORIENTATION=-